VISEKANLVPASGIQYRIAKKIHILIPPWFSASKQEGGCQNMLNGTTHWSIRARAGRFGISNMTVGRIWQARGLQSQRVRPFKASRDKRFADTLVDVVSSHLNVPEAGLALCVDEKGQIQPRTVTSRAFRSRRVAAGRKRTTTS
jgi:hypothetical protein